MHINKTDKVVVTGGTGFLGSHIIRCLLEKGYSNVYALKRSNSPMGLVSGIEHQIHWVEGDILDIKSLESLIQNASAVIHSAAKVSYHPRDREEVMQVNVEGTANVVNVSLFCKISKLIFVSSVAAIGRSKPGQLINENTKWVEDENTTGYGLSKYLAEMEVWRGMQEGLEVGVLNPSMILGPSYWGDSSTKLFTHVYKGSRFYPSGSNGFVDVRDLSKMTVLFLESNVKNERIIAVSEMLSYHSLLEKIAQELRKEPPTVEVSGWVAQILWRILSITADPAITKETVAITSQNFLYDHSRSREVFEINYRSVEDSIRDTCEIYKKNIKEKKDFGFFAKVCC